LVWLVPCTSQLSPPPRAALHGLVLVLCINQIPPPFLAALLDIYHPYSVIVILFNFLLYVVIICIYNPKCSLILAWLVPCTS
jgi:hypothetical protein